MTTAILHGWRVRAAILLTFLLAAIYGIAGVTTAPPAHAYSGYNVVNECWGTGHSVGLDNIWGVWASAPCASWITNKYEVILQYPGYVELCNTSGYSCVRYWAGGSGLVLHYDHIVYTV